MSKEIHTLNMLLIAAITLAPWVTERFLLKCSKQFNPLYLIACAITTASIIFDVSTLSVAWLFFCLAGFGRFLRQNLRPPSMLQVVQSVPFIFSIVGALWLVSGSNGLGLLGYDQTFSYYAALHSTVLGWTMIGCMAALATHAERFNHIYSTAVLVSLGAFFIIAIGIDQAPVIKPIGVAGVTLMVGLSQMLMLHECRSSKLASFFGWISALGFLYTITLAWQHELGIISELTPLGVRPMVSLHGIINGLLVAPCMFLALHVRFAKHRG